jgi:hypothetical protein
VRTIDEYLETLAEIDSLFLKAFRGRCCTKPKRMGELHEQLTRRLLRLLDAHETDGGQS